MHSHPEKIDLEKLKPYYVGSVQKLYTISGHEDLLVSETTSGGSVFDVGTIFDIEGSDTGRAAFRHLVFRSLNSPAAWKEIAGEIELPGEEYGDVEKILSRYSEYGASTHHVGLIDPETGKVHRDDFPGAPSNLTLIRKYSVLKPAMTRVMGRHFFDYEIYHHSDRNVVPLEYIVRLGITSGSSILRKYKRMGDADRAAFLRELGVDNLTPWTVFKTPIIDLTTKYEPEDRNISLQEASCVSGLDGTAFSKTLVMALLGSYMVKSIFKKMGLFLWDLKWEMARDNDDLVFVDTIDTDSVRVTFNLQRGGKKYFVHFNKQSVRDYYRIMHPDWYSSVNDAKAKAATSGRPFTEILSEGQQRGEYPPNPSIERGFMDIQARKFGLIREFISGDAHRFETEASEIAAGEIGFYESAGKLAEYESLNAVQSS